MFGQSYPQYFMPQQMPQPTPAPQQFAGFPGSPQSASDTAQKQYQQFTVNPQIAGITSAFGARGIGNSSFAGSFAGAAAADGAAQAQNVGNQAANAWANSDKTLTDANLAPGYLSNQQQQTANQGTQINDQYNLGLQNVGLQQQQINNQAGQFGQQLGQQYFNSVFGGGF